MRDDSISVSARASPALAAVVVTRAPLHYVEGADASIDRPAHVRAGSSLAWVPGGIALVQDDANFVAVVDPHDGSARAITLPAGAGGGRLFDDLRGNKAQKLDLEACLSVDTGDGVLFIALGSGSTPHREQVLLIRGWEAGRFEPTLVHVPRLYDTLRREQAFAGSELNIEGAVWLGDCVRLFGRGNGALRAGVQPINATCDLDWPAFVAHVRLPERAPPPMPTNIVRYDLGTIDGVPLSFTDATLHRNAILFSATAEESPDVTRDGRVAGSAIGAIDRAGRARWTPLVDDAGIAFAGKVEGLVLSREGDQRAYVVVDADDPRSASILCAAELRGDWGASAG